MVHNKLKSGLVMDLLSLQHQTKIEDRQGDKESNRYRRISPLKDEMKNFEH